MHDHPSPIAIWALVALVALVLLMVFPSTATRLLVSLVALVGALFLIAVVAVFSIGITGAIVMGSLRALGLCKPPQDKTTPKQAAEIIDDFLPGKDHNAYAFDWFCGTGYFTDPRVQAAANECCDIDTRYPAPRAYCNDEGLARMRQIRDDLLSTPDAD